MAALTAGVKDVARVVNLVVKWVALRDKLMEFL